MSIRLLLVAKMSESDFNFETFLTAFAFTKNNISTRVLYRLRNVNSRYQVFGKASIQKYMEFLQHENPRYILGMGVYTGPDQDKIRIETVCTNRFKREFITDSTIQEIEIKPFLKPYKLSKYADDLRTSYCNFVSWEIMNLIKGGKLDAGYTFLHIPKRMRTEDAVKEGEAMIEEFRRSL